jgi:hypothetical protein
MGTITPSSGRVVIELTLDEVLYKPVMNRDGTEVDPHLAIGDAIRRAAWNLLADKAPYIIRKHKFAYGYLELKDGKIVVTFEEHNENPDEPGAKQ